MLTRFCRACGRLSREFIRCSTSRSVTGPAFLRLIGSHTIVENVFYKFQGLGLLSFQETLSPNIIELSLCMFGEI